METSASNPNPPLPDHWLRNYLPLWIGQAVSMLGSGLVQFALVWYLTEKTGSAGVLATATFVALIPGVIIGPFAGALVDRWNRKKTIILSDLGVTLATLVLVALFALDAIQIWHIYAVLFVRALCGTFQGPALSASISLLVPREQYSRLSGINQALYGTINIVSPPLGALLMEVLPIQSVLAVDIVTAALAISLLLFFVTVPQPKRELDVEGSGPRQVWEDVKGGARYVATWPGMLTLLIGASLINMLSLPGFQLMPLLVTGHYGKGAQELAWLESAFGFGIIAGGLCLGVWGGFKRKITTTMAGLLGMGIGILLLGLVPPAGYNYALALMALVGISNAFTNGTLGALVQAKIPPEMQGRVFTIMNSLTMGASPIGLVLAAPIADRLGIQIWYIVAGVSCLLMGTAGLLIRNVATLDDQLPGGKIQVVEQAALAASINTGKD